MKKTKILKEIEKLFKKNGINCLSIINGDKKYLLIQDDNKNIEHIIEITGFHSPLSIDDLRESFLAFESMSEYNCRDYKVISIRGYLQEHKNELDKIRDLGVALYDSSELTYLSERIHSNSTSPVYLLYSHNEKAFSNIVDRFKESNYAAIVHATGTGKSKVFLKLIERNYKQENVIVLAPSIDILNQTEDTAKKMGLKNIKYLTYAKLYTLKDDELKELNPVLIIADELHRLGARTYDEGFRKLVHFHPMSKVLGVTATPVRTLDHNRNMIDELFQGSTVSTFTLEEALVRGLLPKPKYIYAIYDIEEEITSLRRSIDNGDLSCEDKINLVRKLEHLKINWDESNEVSNILKKHIDESTKKIVVFCENLASLQRYMVMVQEWFNCAGFETNALAITSHDSYKSRRDKLKYFKEIKPDSSIELLFCVNILNEGVHISDINGCIFLRRTASEILYLQQLGRVLEANKKVNPVVFDFVCNIDNVKNNALEYKMQYYDDRENSKKKKLNLDIPQSPSYYEKEAIIETYNEAENIEKLLLGFRNSIKNPWNINYKKLKSFHLKYGHSDVFNNCSDHLLFIWCVNQLNLYEEGKLDSEKVALLEELDFKWHKLSEKKWYVNFFKLRKYIYGYNISEHKDKLKDDAKIRSWCIYQRSCYKKGFLGQEKIILLNSINFDWNIKNTLWINKYMEFREHYRNSGYNFNELKKHNSVNLWIKRQYMKFKQGALDEELAYLLDGVTLQWRGVETSEVNVSADISTQWIYNYLKLKRYFDKNGNSDVPSKYKDDTSLGYWVKKQKGLYKNGSLTDEKVRLLNDLKFKWINISSQNRTWDESYKELKIYYAEHNDCEVPRIYNGDSKLSNWINRQRRRYKDNTLSLNEYKQLNELGFKWD